MLLLLLLLCTFEWRQWYKCATTSHCHGWTKTASSNKPQYRHLHQWCWEPYVARLWLTMTHPPTIIASIWLTTTIVGRFTTHTSKSSIIVAVCIRLLKEILYARTITKWMVRGVFWYIRNRQSWSKTPTTCMRHRSRVVECSSTRRMTQADHHNKLIDAWNIHWINAILSNLDAVSGDTYSLSRSLLSCSPPKNSRSIYLSIYLSIFHFSLPVHLLSY